MKIQDLSTLNLKFILNTEASTFTIGGRTFPCQFESTTNASGMETRRVLILTDAGLTISIIWGSLTYSSNNQHSDLQYGFIECPELVEIMVSPQLGSEVIGYCSTSQVLLIIDDPSKEQGHFKLN
jgi:hypothetical protein